MKSGVDATPLVLQDDLLTYTMSTEFVSYYEKEVLAFNVIRISFNCKKKAFVANNCSL